MLGSPRTYTQLQVLISRYFVNKHQPGFDPIPKMPMVLTYTWTNNKIVVYGSLNGCYSWNGINKSFYSQTAASNTAYGYMQETLQARIIIMTYSKHSAHNVHHSSGWNYWMLFLSHICYYLGTGMWLFMLASIHEIHVYITGQDNMPTFYGVTVYIPLTGFSNQHTSTVFLRIRCSYFIKMFKRQAITLW